MSDGYDYPNDSNKISALLSPGYFHGAFGLDFKHSNVFAAYLAPLTTKITIVNNQPLADIGAFGVDKGENVRVEFGSYVRLAVKKHIMKNIELHSKLDLFSNFLDRPQNIDVNWETLISMKVNRFVSATITTHLMYDDDVLIGVDTNDDGIADLTGPRLQFKEVLGVGFTYKFQ